MGKESMESFGVTTTIGRPGVSDCWLRRNLIFADCVSGVTIKATGGDRHLCDVLGLLRL